MITQQKREHTVQSLTKQNIELKQICQLWIAANDAKDDKIHQLERKIGNLKHQLAMLSATTRKRRHRNRQSPVSAPKVTSRVP